MVVRDVGILNDANVRDVVAVGRAVSGCDCEGEPEVVLSSCEELMTKLSTDVEGDAGATIGDMWTMVPVAAAAHPMFDCS